MTVIDFPTRVPSTAAASGTEKSVLGRGLHILDALSKSVGSQSLPQIARATGLPKSTVHRMVSQLVEQGLLAKAGQGFTVGLRVFEWGSRAASQRDLRDAALPYLFPLHAHLGETVHLGVLDGSEIVCIEKLRRRGGSTTPGDIGDRRPAHSTALGKALLAFTPGGLAAALSAPLVRATPRTVVLPALLRDQLEKVRRNMVAVEFEETFVGTACVAAPVFGPGGAAVGALSVSLPANRCNVRVLANVISQAAHKVTRELAASAGAAGSYH